MATMLLNPLPSRALTEYEAGIVNAIRREYYERLAGTKAEVTEQIREFLGLPAGHPYAVQLLERTTAVAEGTPVAHDPGETTVDLDVRRAPSRPGRVHLITGRAEMWMPDPSPGGWVCAEPPEVSVEARCGLPVESEPCPIHHPKRGTTT